MRDRRHAMLDLVVLCAAASLSFAQYGGGRRGVNAPITPLPANRAGVPSWPVDPAFPQDTFTFVRLRFTSGPFRRPDKTGEGWKTDWPSADLNFSYRLQQLT